jgi:hypothetical protein
MPFPAEQAAQESRADLVVVGNQDVCVSDHGDMKLQNEGR